MTEQEWLAATDPTPMLEFLRSKVSDRKLRLFACARCRELWHMLSDERCRTAVEVGERFADHEATAEELQAAQNDSWIAFGAAREGYKAVTRAMISAVANNLPTENEIWETAWDEVPDESEQSALRTAEGKQVPLLQDIFGNPFRPVTADPSWLTSTVTALARGIYDERAFDRLPILADALQDAGCDHPDILAHCRSDGPHVRGCWVVDLVLGKA